MTDNPVYIIGNTATAYTLAARLILSGENVLVMPGLDAQRFSSPFLLREDNMLQKNRLPLPTAQIMNLPAKMVIFDIKPDELKTFMTYFSPSKASDCPLLSLCHTRHTSLMTQILRRPPIQAVFNGWLSLHNNTLTILGRKNELTVCANERVVHFERLRDTLAKTYFTINFSDNEKQNFWNFFIPFATCSLFSLIHSKSIRDITKFPQLRLSLNTILDEIITAAPADISIDKEQILSFIYSTPGNYVYPIVDDIKKHRCGELMFIAETLDCGNRNNANKMPEVQKIIRQNLKKKLSSVEE